MSFGTTFTDAAAEMEGDLEQERAPGQSTKEWISVGGHTREEVAAFYALRDKVDSMRHTPTVEEREWLNQMTLDLRDALHGRREDSDPYVAAHAAGKAHAAAQSVSPGIDMNVVITFADAARTFAYRGLNALAGKLHEIAQRIAPDR